MNKIFTKNDLKDGMVIVQRDGKALVIVGKKAINSDGINSMCRYTDSLEWDTSHRYDIVKVYEPDIEFTTLDDYVEFTKDQECSSSGRFKLVWERKEKKEIKLTTEERAFLNSILLVSDYKYIARDKKCDALWVFKAKPSKGSFSCEWIYNPGDFHGAEITDKTKGMFEFISWTDDEPYLIEDLLKGDIK